MKKNFKITGRSRTSPRTVPRKTAASEVATGNIPNRGPTTRKTIEVPEEYFYQVKMRALERRIKEKELWAEILFEYFQNHPPLRRS
jgi:hypothetical protein